MNLERDKRVLGHAWKKTYKGYFGNKKNIHKFISCIFPFLPLKRTLSILYAASASGELGETLVKKLATEKKIRAHLTLVDISTKQLTQNKNPHTQKICADLMKMHLSKKYDIILMRSSLDYFSTEKKQIHALKKIRNWLAKDGVFFNQPAYLPTVSERNLADRIYRSNDKIGRRHFQSSDIKQLYSLANLKMKKIGVAPKMRITEKEHVQRYHIGEKEVKRIQKIISHAPKSKRPNIKITPRGYSMTFHFPIFAAWKNFP